MADCDVSGSNVCRVLRRGIRSSLFFHTPAHADTSITDTSVQCYFNSLTHFLFYGGPYLLSNLKKN